LLPETLVPLTAGYEEKIVGVLSCHDRIIIRGTIPGRCFDKVMISFLVAQNIRILGYPACANGLREEVRENAEHIARENGL
jgi:hypothetical protein